MFPVVCFTREGVKFWSKVEITPTCWVWHGAKTHGYGTVRHANAATSAHRIAYTSMVGPIPEGLQLDHLCRNRACVRPDHLEAVTSRENSARGLGNGWGKREVCWRGHAYTEESTRWRNRNGRLSRVCRICKRLDDAERRAAA